MLKYRVSPGWEHGLVQFQSDAASFCRVAEEEEPTPCAAKKATSRELAAAAAPEDVIMVGAFCDNNS